MGPDVTRYAAILGPFAYRPVELLRRLGAFPTGGGLAGAGEPPEDPGQSMVLLDSAGGSPKLATRSLVAWRPRAHLWAKDQRVVVSRAADGWAREESRGDPFPILRALTAEEAASDTEWWGPHGDDLDWVGAYGLVCYDAGRYIEVLPDTTAGRSPHPGPGRHVPDPLALLRPPARPGDGRGRQSGSPRGDGAAGLRRGAGAAGGARRARWPVTAGRRA